MFDLNDVEVNEGKAANEMEYFVSLQRAINSLSAWRMQGSMGRAMMGAIEAGKCMLGRTTTRDYWSNRIPARDEVEAGTKGSFEYVRARAGDDWARMMEKVS